MPSLPNKPTQDNRQARLDTPLDKDLLLLARMEASEGLSQLFEYRIDALSLNQNINFDDLTGHNCCVTLNGFGDTKRYFNGVLVEGQRTGPEQHFQGYRLVLRPWLWLLGRKANCKIFEKKKVTGVIEEVFRDGGFSDFEMGVDASQYPEIEYCVQYRETDLAFVSRLMEEWGIYTFYKHSADKHVLVLADSRACHVPVGVQGGKVPFVERAAGKHQQREHFSEWTAERRLRTGKMAVKDFDYMKPGAPLKAEARSSELYKHSKLEAYDYPGRYTEQDLGDKRAKVRLEAEQAFDHRFFAAGTVPSLYAGALVTLSEHPDAAQYLVVLSTHTYLTETYRSGSRKGGDTYRGQYELQPSDRPFRAPLVTPKPLVQGPQTAMVVTRKGFESEEIDVDDEGRIFVQFHWNRDKERISRPVRVAQMWSGKGWGWQMIPRVGQEVVVDFLEGDPDQPLVVGTVYNKDYPYPWKLAKKKNISGVQSVSTKDGTIGENFNELSFDDTKGEELVNFQAEKNLTSLVKMNEKRHVKHDRKTDIDNDDKKNVGHDWKVVVGEKTHIKSGSEITLEVGASKIVMKPESITIQSGTIDIKATMDMTLLATTIKLN